MNALRVATQTTFYNRQPQPLHLKGAAHLPVHFLQFFRPRGSM